MNVHGHALVIGGASGIGRGCALAFAVYGASSVVVADLNLEAARAVAEECRGIRSSTAASNSTEFVVEAFYVDVTNAASVEALFRAVKAELGRVDYCVNSAGIGVSLPYEVSEASVDEFTSMLNVNVTGTFLVTQFASAAMKTQDFRAVDSKSPGRGSTRGVIVSLGSASSFVASPKMIQYTTSKHAVVGITKNAALDNAAYGIRVNSVCPSWVDTPMIRKAAENIPGFAEMATRAVPLGRIALCEEVADAVIFLCSPRASYATGCNLILDGGTTLASNT